MAFAVLFNLHELLPECDYVTFGYMPPQIRLWSVVCLSSVCNVYAPYSPGRFFPQCFYAVLYDSHPLTSVQNFTEIVPGKPLRWGLNAIDVAKYSDVAYVDSYISDSETVQDTASDTIND